MWNVGSLFPDQGTNSWPTAVEVWILNHWTTSEVPKTVKFQTGFHWICWGKLKIAPVSTLGKRSSSVTLLEDISMRIICVKAVWKSMWTVRLAYLGRWTGHRIRVSRKEKKACVVGNHRIRSRGHQAFQKGHLSCLAWEQSLRTCLLQGLWVYIGQTLLLLTRHSSTVGCYTCEAVLWFGVYH